MDSSNTFNLLMFLMALWLIVITKVVSRLVLYYIGQGVIIKSLWGQNPDYLLSCFLVFMNLNVKKTTIMHVLRFGTFWYIHRSFCSRHRKTVIILYFCYTLAPLSTKSVHHILISENQIAQRNFWRRKTVPFFPSSWHTCQQDYRSTTISHVTLIQKLIISWNN